jgi:hypothetical protein
VLEHIEPEYVDNVVKELRRLTLEHAIVAIAMMPSSKLLPDGRNSHLSLHDEEWWDAKLKEHGFTIKAKKPMDKVINMTWFICQ